MNFKYSFNSTNGELPTWVDRTFATYGAFSVALIVALAILSLIFASAVWRDAQRLQNRGKRVFLVGPFWWFLLTFFFTIPTVALYWAVHHSTLSTSLDDAADAEQTIEPDSFTVDRNSQLFREFLNDDPIAKHVDSEEQKRRFADWRVRKAQQKLPNTQP
jgi:hypothetical protein